MPVARDVSHRVFVEHPPDAVWPHLVAPAEGAELGVDCVGMLALPRSGPGSLPEFATVWRRSNGRLWAGLATVIDLEHGVRVVSRAADGAEPLDLVTTLEPLDHGSVVTQRLDVVAPGDRVADFARGWMARGLLGLKADVEGTERRRMADPDADELVERQALLGYAPEAGQPGVAPVTERVSVEVALSPERLWAFLSEPSTEQLVKPTVERLVRVALADEPQVEHVLAVHRRDDGRRAVSVSRIVDASRPVRIVERDLTSPHESDVETTIEASREGSVLTETLTAWLPAGPRRVLDQSAVAGLMRTRLDVVKHLAEHGVSPQRDPRTGFLPPGQVPQSAPRPPMPTPVGLPVRPSVPSSVLMPPPHVVAPASGYSFRHDWWMWADMAFFAADDLDWW
jgi:hypothetical protein